ncbi:MAG: phospho-sugar mutase [bacterium]
MSKVANLLEPLMGFDYQGKSHEEVLKTVSQWLGPDYDQETRKELQDLIDSGAGKELLDRFYLDLQFGTGGMRGVMAAGTNRMNNYVVRQATQGLCNYLRSKYFKLSEIRAVVAHDCRHNSQEFARETACVFAANGVKAYLFDELRPTPELSFAVRHLGAQAGVVVTASHNPPNYNGYKVYGDDGAQVIPPEDDEIIRNVRAIKSPREVKNADFHDARSIQGIILLDRMMDEAYLDAIMPLVLRPEVIARQGKALKIVYTPLHGTGTTLATKALNKWGFESVSVVTEQEQPDGNFSTVKSPNPEEGPALEMAINLAKKEEADLVLATDPDADRLGIAVRDKDGEYILFSGNQVHAFLTYFRSRELEALGKLPPPGEGMVLSTIVTTPLIRKIAKSYGLSCIETLTGFKWLAAKLGEFENPDGSFSKTYVFGGEESYGYLVGTHARDKDGVAAACVVAEAAAVCKDRGESLLDLWDEICCTYGLYFDSQINFALPGAVGQKRIQTIVAILRGNPPKEIADEKVQSLVDIGLDVIKSMPSGNIVGRAGLPRSEVLIFELAGGSRVIVRPSGTEPKIKFYFTVCDDTDLPLSRSSLKERGKALREKQNRLQESFLAILERNIKSDEDEEKKEA